MCVIQVLSLYYQYDSVNLSDTALSAQGRRCSPIVRSSSRKGRNSLCGLLELHDPQCTIGPPSVYSCSYPAACTMMDEEKRMEQDWNTANTKTVVSRVRCVGLGVCTAYAVWVSRCVWDVVRRRFQCRGRRYRVVQRVLSGITERYRAVVQSAVRYIHVHTECYTVQSYRLQSEAEWYREV